MTTSKKAGHKDEDSNFHDDSKLTKDLPALSVIRIWHGEFIEGIETCYGQLTSGQHIGKERKPSDNINELILSQGEYITQVGGRSGAWLDRISFKTNYGRTLECGKSTGGEPFNFEVPGMVVSYFKYEVGNHVNLIEVIFDVPKSSGPMTSPPGVTTLPACVPMPIPSYPHNPVPTGPMPGYNPRGGMHGYGQGPHGYNPRGGYPGGGYYGGGYPGHMGGYPGYGQPAGPMPLQPVKSQSFGGTHGDTKYFDDYTELLAPLIEQGCDPSIEEVVLWEGDKLLLGIECKYRLVYQNGSIEYKKVSHIGKNKGFSSRSNKLTLGSGETIVSAQGRNGNLVDFFELVTSSGAKVSAGGKGGDEFNIQIPHGRKIIAFGGATNGCIHHIYVYHA